MCWHVPRLGPSSGLPAQQSSLVVGALRGTAPSVWLPPNGQRKVHCAISALCEPRRLGRLGSRLRLRMGCLGAKEGVPALLACTGGWNHVAFDWPRWQRGCTSLSHDGCWQRWQGLEYPAEPPCPPPPSLACFPSVHSVSLFLSLILGWV